MAEKKFSDLTAKGAALADTDLLAISEDAGGGAYTSKSVTGANVKALVTDANLTTTDITTNDVSTSKHGFAPKAPNDTTKFLRGDGTWAVPSAGSTSGKFGIADSNGAYTYYTTLQAAITAASAGQTVEMFTDYTETTATTVTLKNGVNINGNGHTYSYTFATGNCFIDNGVAVICTISDLNINRTNYTSGSVYVQSSTSSDTDWSNSKINITAASGDAVSVLGKIRNIWVKVTGNGNGLNSAYTSNAQFFNCYAEVTGSGTAMLARTSTVYSCTAIGVSGVGCYGDQSSHYNCYYFASSGYAVQYGNIYNSSLVTVSGQASRLANAYNCSIISTSGSCAVNQTNTFVDCTLRNGSGEVTLFTADYYNCNLYTASNRISTGYSNNFYNSVLHSGWNNASGHCLTVIANNEIANSTLIVSNASANCLNSASAISVKYANNTFKGATTPVNANITQGISNTQDNQGNILL